MSKNKSTELVPVGAPASEKWETPEEAFTELQTGMLLIMSQLTQFMWEVGQVATWAQEDAEYGDGVIERMAEMFHRKKTWIYECMKMHQRYDWETIEARFIAAGVPASSIARLACIEDQSTRNYVEDKLVANEIHYDDILQAKKEYEDKINDTEHTQAELGEGLEPSMEELQAQKRVGEESDQSRAASVHNSYFGGVETDIDALLIKLDDKFFAAVDQLAIISDEGLYDLAMDRMVRCGVKMKKLKIVLTNHVGSIAMHRPSEFEDEDK